MSLEKMFDPSSWYTGLTVFPFENEDLLSTMDRFSKRYPYVGFFCGFVYVLIVFGIQQWMRHRKPYKLTITSVLWNLSLAILNVVAAFRIFPFLASLQEQTSFYTTICADISFSNDPVCGFWVRLFPFIKIIELGDTCLIVLQKRRLATYYWTHHLGALLISWHLFPYLPTAAMWLSLIVDVFHVPVYVYSTLNSLKVRMSAMIRVSLGLLEMVHMIVSLTFCTVLFHYIWRNMNCNIHTFDVILLTSIYTFCLALTTQLLMQRLAQSWKIAPQKSVR